jgi:hypothetical protein
MVTEVGFSVKWSDTALGRAILRHPPPFTSNQIKYIYSDEAFYYSYNIETTCFIVD